MTKIIYKKGDVTEAAEKVILHGCNAQGVMGSGVAKAIRAKFPETYEAYRVEHVNFGLKLGSVYHSHSCGFTVLHAITQDKYGTNKRHLNYEAIYTALTTIDEAAPPFGWSAIAMPRIGAGLGGGNWRIIEAMIEETSTNYQPVVYDL